MMISHYAFKFIQLSLFVPKLIANESKKANRFLKSLRADIYDRVAMFRPTTYAKVLENAQLAQELLVARYR